MLLWGYARARVLPRLYFRGTARFSPPRKTSLDESARSSATEAMAETLAARIFNMPLKHNLVTRAYVAVRFIAHARRFLVLNCSFAF